MIKNFKCSGYASDVDKNSSNPFVTTLPSKITIIIEYYNSLSNFVPVFEKHILIDCVKRYSVYELLQTVR